MISSCRSISVRLPIASLTLLLLFTFATARESSDYEELPRFHKVSEKLFRGGQPRTGGIQRIAELGVNTIVNLRGTSNRTRADEAEARALGLNYVNVSLPRWGRPDHTRIMRVIEVVVAPESGRVFVHCRDGLDRTGTVIALYRIIQEGWTTNDALIEADKQGMRRIQYWMRDYVEDYGRSIRKDSEVAGKQININEDFGAQVGNAVRILEKNLFKMRKAGKNVLRRAPRLIIPLLD